MSDDDDRYLIWSNEHEAWWGPGGYGYARTLAGAGHYSRERAIEICVEALMTGAHIGKIAEVPVRLADINAMLLNASNSVILATRKAVWGSA